MRDALLESPQDRRREAYLLDTVAFAMKADDWVQTPTTYPYDGIVIRRDDKPYFVEAKVRYKSYGDELWVPARKVHGVLDAALRSECHALLTVWYTDKTGLGEIYVRRLIEGDDKASGQMRPRLSPREGVSEDQSTEPAVVFSLAKDFKRLV